MMPIPFSKTYESQSYHISSIKRFESGHGELDKKSISHMKFVKSKEMIATSSFKIDKKKNKKYVCYYGGNDRHARSIATS